MMMDAVFCNDYGDAIVIMESCEERRAWRDSVGA